MADARHKAGAAAEDAAARFLVARGLVLLARNRRWRDGELDLILRDGDTLVFVEVRHRQGMAFGGAAASVTRSKQQRLIRAAGHFLAENPALAALPARFDVITSHGDAARPTLQWLRQAFEL